METILIIAAVLVITVAVVLTVNSIMGGPQDSSSVIDDKFAASMRGAELLGYNSPFDPNNPASAPTGVRLNREIVADLEVLDDWDLLPADAQYLASITGTDGKVYPIFVTSGGGGGKGRAYVAPTSVDADDDDDGILNVDEAPGCVSDPAPACGVPTMLPNLAINGMTLVSADDPSTSFDGEVPEGSNVLVGASVVNFGDAPAASFTVSFYYALAPKTLPVTDPNIVASIFPLTGLALASDDSINPPTMPVCPNDEVEVCGIDGNDYLICDASDINVEIGYAGYCDASMVFIGLATVPSLDYGDSAVVSATINGIPAGDYNIYAILDPADDVLEGNEADNVDSTTIGSTYVQTDLYVNSNDIIRPKIAMVGSPLSFTAAVHNSGTAVSGVVVSFFETPAMSTNPVVPITANAVLPITGYLTKPPPTKPVEPTPVPCPDTSDVCGADDVPYADYCAADNAGVAVVYNGACVTGWHYLGSDTIDVGTASSTDATASWTPSVGEEGSYQAIVWIDPFGVLDEASVGNNYAESLAFTVSEMVLPIPTIIPTPTATINPPQPDDTAN